MIPDLYEPATPSPRCGRLDDHPPHRWTNRITRNSGSCPGVVTTEGATACVDCGEPTANGGCRCLPCARLLQEHHDEQNAEWWR